MRPTSVFVGGLGSDIEKEDVEREFSRFGTLNKVWVARNPSGFAFVEFEDDEEAQEAIREMNGATINGSEIRVDLSRGREGRGGDREGRGGDREGRGGDREGRGFGKTKPSVFVGGLGSDIEKEDLEREFSKFGTLNKVWVARNPPGFAFIEFEDDEEAQEAIREMNGATINGSEIRVDLSRGGGRGGGRGRRGAGGGSYTSGFRGGRSG